MKINTQKTIFLIICIALTQLYLTQAGQGLYPRSDHICDDIPGFYWDGQKCELCETENCYCSGTPQSCQKCAPGFGLYQFPDYINTCFSCYPDGQVGVNKHGIAECCFEDLRTDWTASIALNQHQPSYLAGRAITCVQPFRDPDQPASTNLTVIFKNYGGYCHFIKYCLTYNNYGLCNECQKGTYLNQNQMTCQLCTVSDQNCVSCRGPNQCDQCRSGTFMATNANRNVLDTTIAKYDKQTCLNCGDGCLCSGKIVQETPLNCDMGCINGYFQETATKCTQCFTNCFSCSVNSDKKQICTQCLKREQIPSSTFGYIVDSSVNSNSTSCAQCPDNCYICAFNTATGKPYCDTNGCDNGYWLNNGLCTKCVQAFSSRCSSDKIVTQCHSQSSQFVSFASTFIPHNSGQQSYYLLKSQNKCVQNINDCRQMDENSVSGACTSCYDGYQLVKSSQGDNVCKKCPATCKNCTVEGTVPTQYLSCICRSNVDNLTPADVENTDISNFYLDQSSKNCIQGPTGCLNFQQNSQGVCQSCQSGFYNKTTSGSLCAQCSVKNCKTCISDAASCSSCFGGFVKITDGAIDTCVACPHGCKACTTSRTTCQECLSGYYLNNLACQAIKANCISWDKSIGDCKYCSYGYRNVRGNCYSSIIAGQGYVNEEFGCRSSFRYQNDGNTLAPAANPSEHIGAQQDGIIQRLSILLLSVLLVILF